MNDFSSKLVVTRSNGASGNYIQADITPWGIALSGEGDMTTTPKLLLSWDEIDAARQKLRQGAHEAMESLQVFLDSFERTVRE
jgi:hypothetical protein